MINSHALLEKFLGPNAASQMSQTGVTAKQKLDSMGMAGFGGGAVAGGILGLMLGSKKMRKMAGGMMAYGGAAAAGALAYKAYQNWQQGQTVATAPVAQQADLANLDPKFMPGATQASDGQAFELLMIKAMIAAAKADGHIDGEEQRAIFEQVEKMGLDTESKAFVFDALTQPVDIAALTASVRGIEQATELYLISRIAIDPDHPAERAYLQALGHRLNLPEELLAHLDHQVNESGLARE
jgi:uncharacterized membrane protein YebE (DUF533 family)